MSNIITLEALGLDLPEIAEPTVLSFDGETYVATKPDGEETRATSLKDVYSKVRSQTSNLKFSETIPDLDPEMPGIVFLPVDEKGRGSIITAVNDHDLWGVLNNDLDIFLKNNDDFNKSPNFYNAHKFLNTHPMFWRKAINEPGPTWDWKTNLGIETFDMFVFEENSNVVIALEAGPVVRDLEDDEYITIITDY